MSYPLLVTSVGKGRKVNGHLLLDHGVKEFLEDVAHAETPLQEDCWTWPGDVPEPFDIAEPQTGAEILERLGVKEYLVIERSFVLGIGYDEGMRIHLVNDSKLAWICMTPSELERRQIERAKEQA